MGAFIGFMGAALRAKNAGLPAGQAGFKALMGVYKSGAAAGQGDGIKGNAASLGMAAVNSYIDRLKNPPGSAVAAVPGQKTTLATSGMLPPSGTALLGTHTLLGQ